MAARNSFYIATPIFYVNDVPHIGHAYTEVAADVLARWHRQSGDDTWLLTGTDEHGQKILRTAVANDTTPKAWADKLLALYAQGKRPLVAVGAAHLAPPGGLPELLAAKGYKVARVR